MSDSFLPTDGLSKREQSKLERLIKNESGTDKTNTHSKSYKKKSGRQPQNILQPAQRRMIKTSSIPSQAISQQGSSPNIDGQKQKDVEIKKVSKKKIDPLNQKALNPKFLQQGGQDMLFEYILTYSYTEKQKQLEAPEEDLSCLEKLQGKKLDKDFKKSFDTKERSLSSDFQNYKKKINYPFDEKHRELLQGVISKILGMHKN